MTDEFEKMNAEIKEMGEILKNDVDRIITRFRYRTMINRSYSKEESAKIEEQIWQSFRQKANEIADLWKIIG